MVTYKAGSPRRITIVLALVLLPVLSTSLSAAEIYIRPLVQYTWLPTSSRNAKSDPLNFPSFGGGVASPVPPVSTAKGSEYISEGSAAGFGIAVGAAVGREQRYEVGAEGTRTEFDGTYTLTPLRSYSTTGEVVAALPPRGGQPCHFEVRSVVATFRRWFGLSADQVRPYVGVVLGFTDIKFHPGGRDPNVIYYDDAGDTNISYGLGLGVRYKFSGHFAVEANYRFLDAGGLFTHADFYSPAHIVSVAIDGRF